MAEGDEWFLRSGSDDGDCDDCHWQGRGVAAETLAMASITEDAVEFAKMMEREEWRRDLKVFDPIVVVAMVRRRRWC